MRKACQWLELNYQQNPFYLMVDTFDPHEPWNPPEWYIRRFDPEDYDGPEPIYPPYGPDQMDQRTTQRLNALYRAEACLVDRWIGHLLTQIQNVGLLDNTMVIFMADHGFLLGEQRPNCQKLQHVRGGGPYSFNSLSSVSFPSTNPGTSQHYRSSSYSGRFLRCRKNGVH
jgi:arylsulfatase A-like enzyme